MVKWKSRVKSGEFFVINSSLDETIYHIISAAETLSNSNINLLKRDTESSETLNTVRSMFFKIVDNTLTRTGPSQKMLLDSCVNEFKKEIIGSEERAGKLRNYVYLPIIFF